MTGSISHPSQADCQRHDQAQVLTGSNNAGACCAAAPVSVGVPHVAALAAGQARTAIRILQMDCPTEETLIRNVLGPMNGVHDLQFNLMQRVLTVVHRPDAINNVLQAVRKLGFQPEIAQSGSCLLYTSPSPRD